MADGQPRGTVHAEASGTVPRRTAGRRIPLLALGALSMLSGLWGGLVLLRTGVPVPRQSFAEQHGPLMALGFLGTLISLERSVALGRPWGYAAPALAGLGALATAAGFTGIGRPLLTAGGAWFVAVYIALYGRRPGRSPGRDLIIQTAGAAGWYVAGLLWLDDHAVADMVPWLMAFLVLTIAGERLELARVAFLRRRAADGLVVAAALIGVGAVVSVPAPEAGWRTAGVGMIVLAGWLAGYDIARKTIGGTGLPRYAAACLLSGYAWLAVAGTLWTFAGFPRDEGPYDAALHTVFLGFVVSMVFGHAPVILPAVLRVRLPYHPLLYAPLVLLHVSVLIRVVSDLTGMAAARTVGGVLGEVAMLGFVACAVASSRMSRRPSAAKPASARTPMEQS